MTADAAPRVSIAMNVTGTTSVWRSIAGACEQRSPILT